MLLMLSKEITTHFWGLLSYKTTVLRANTPERASEQRMNGRTNPRGGFSADDVDLLVDALSLNESMLGAAQATRFIERTTHYPIRSLEDLRATFERFGDANHVITLGDHKVTLTQAERYLPREGFPIENREQLLSRIVVAFEIGKLEGNRFAQELVRDIRPRP